MLGTPPDAPLTYVKAAGATIRTLAVSAILGRLTVRSAVSRIALTVLGLRPDTPLSPFFGKARFVLLVDPETEALSFLTNRGWSSEWMRHAIAGTGAARLLCSYIDPASLAHLVNARIDVRLGPCSRPAMDLIGAFPTLPRALRDDGSWPPLPADDHPAP
jgi:hypothetical protein